MRSAVLTVNCVWQEKAQLLEAENKELQASMTRQRDEQVSVKHFCTRRGAERTVCFGQVDIFKFLNEQLLHRTLKNEAFEHQLAEAEMQANVQVRPWPWPTLVLCRQTGGSDWIGLV